MEVNSELRTPDRGIKFPSGHILIHEKWRNSELGSQFTKQGNITYSDALGLVDFYLAEHCPVVYVTESDMVIAPTEIREKLSKFSAVFKGRGIVVMVWNVKTSRDFIDIQEYATLDLELFVFPCGCHEEIPTVLHKLMTHYIRSPSKITGRNKKALNSSQMLERQLALLTSVQGVGEEKAKALLHKYGNIASISAASQESLSSTVGDKVGKHIFSFFHSNCTKRQ